MFACRGCHGLSYRSQTRRDKVYLDFVRPQNQLKRIREGINHTRNDEDRKQLEAQAEVLEQRLDEFQSGCGRYSGRLHSAVPFPLGSAEPSRSSGVSGRGRRRAIS